MDYAVVETGGKQYRVSEGDVIEVEKLPGSVGETVELRPVLMIRQGKKIATDPGQLAQASIHAQIVRHGRDKKVIVFKYRPRKRYRRKLGHRQSYTRLLVEDIVVQ